MKKIMMFSCILAAMAGFTSCEDDNNGNGGYEGVNYIYLTAQDGKTTMFENDTEPLVVDVMLTTALDKDLVLTFAVNGTEGVVSLQGNPVTVKAGEKTAKFSVVSNDADLLEAAANFTVGLASSTVLPENVELKDALSFVVTPVVSEEVTDPQQVIIDAYKAATGVDLSKFIGTVNVSVEYTGFDNENEVALDPVTFTGKTVIAMSESATEELPVLKMVSNPMGIQDQMYAVLRSVTVEDTEYWCDAESYPDNTNLMETIGWNKDSEEVFSMSLDGISFNADNSVDFLGTGMDQYGDEITIVPFSYEFTAYERELEAIADGSFVRDEYSYDATANPAYHLNNTDISEDLCEYGNWVEASASVSEDALVFTFCVYMCINDYDYTRIVATYTPNN